MPSNNNSIIAFKEGFYGGTRANRFIVSPTWPSKVSVNANDASFKVVSASLPVVQINTISVPYRGRNITFAGDRLYSTWAIGIYDDNNTQNIWKGLHKWVELMDGHYTHQVDGADYSYKKLQTTWNVKQLDSNGNVLKTIYLYKCWPSVVGEINLNMGESSFVGFSATLTFDHIRIQDNYNS
jgi:hypothetical protein